MKRIYLIAAVMLASLKSFFQGAPEYGRGLKFNLKDC